MDINKTYCNNFAIFYTYIKSLFCTPKTNAMLYVNDISIKNELERKVLLITSFMHSVILMVLKMASNKQGQREIQDI